MIWYTQRAQSGNRMRAFLEGAFAAPELDWSNFEAIWPKGLSAIHRQHVKNKPDELRSADLKQFLRRSRFQQTSEVFDLRNQMLEVRALRGVLLLFGVSS